MLWRLCRKTSHAVAAHFLLVLLFLVVLGRHVICIGLDLFVQVAQDLVVVLIVADMCVMRRHAARFALEMRGSFPVSDRLLRLLAEA